MLRNYIELYVDFEKRIKKFEEDLTPLVTVDLDEVGEFSEVLINKIKSEIGMPIDEDLGVFVFDYWYDLLFDVVEDNKSIDEVLPQFENCNKVFK